MSDNHCLIDIESATREQLLAEIERLGNCATYENGYEISLAWFRIGMQLLKKYGRGNRTESSHCSEQSVAPQPPQGMTL